LNKAIAAGDVRKVQTLLAQGVSLETLSPRGDDSPLANAAASGNIEITKMILGAGADPSQESHSALHIYCTSALGFAVSSGNRQVVELLLAVGAKPNGKDGKHNIALRFACRKGDVGMVRLLLAKGARADIPTLYQHNPVLASASGYGQQEERAEIARMLIAKGANARQKNIDGETTATIARKNGQSLLLKVLEDQQKLPGSNSGHKM
jgi:ankyrin repeat protein